jgi:hypothetical protein
LDKLPKNEDPNLLAGFETSDDAGIYRLTDEIALITTADFITPPVNDPYTFGQIAAANAISDVYAMGGRPITCLNLAIEDDEPKFGLAGHCYEMVKGSQATMEFSISNSFPTQAYGRNQRLCEPRPEGVVSLEPETRGKSRRKQPNRLLGRRGGRPYKTLRFQGRRRAGHRARQQEVPFRLRARQRPNHSARAQELLRSSDSLLPHTSACGGGTG